jgi:hypothetical protein
MRRPPSVHAVLSPSRIAGAGIGLLATATVALSIVLPLPPHLQIAMIVAIVAWAAWTFQLDALHRGRFAVTELRLAPDLMLLVCMGDGRLVAGQVHASTYTGAWVTAIVWRPDGRRRSRALLVLPDMLPAEEFRRLRVMLRYARSGEVQDVPASQA